MKATTKLRKIMSSGKTIVKPGVFDAMSARLMENCGFKAIGVSGYSVSFSYLGKPDLGFTNLTDIATICRNIASAVSIPIIADADTGYGNAVNVMYTTEVLIKTGVAAFHMEDQEFPKRCGHVGGKKVIPVEEMVGKIKAAVKVRDELDKDFVIIARCDARGAYGGSLKELIDRSNAYMDAGADMIFPEGIPTEEELRIVADKVRGPLHYNRTGGKKLGGLSPLIPLEVLQEIGICITSAAVGPLQAAAKAMWEWGTNTMKDDVEFLKRNESELIKTPIGNLHELSDMGKYLELEKAFLPKEDLQKYEGSLGFKVGEKH